MLGDDQAEIFQRVALHQANCEKLNVLVMKISPRQLNRFVLFPLLSPVPPSL